MKQLNSRRIGKRCRAVRESKGFTPAQMAYAIGCKHTTVLRVERGEQLPLLQYAGHVAEMGNMTIEQLIYGGEANAR